MGRRKTISEAGPCPAMTFYCPPSLKEIFKVKVCVPLDVSISERLRTLMHRDVEEHNGGMKVEEYPMEDKEYELRKLLKTEGDLEKILCSEAYDAHRTIYDVLYAFSLKLLGRKEIGDLETLKQKLHQYDLDGSEPFDDRHLEYFIQLVETRIQREKLHGEIKAFRRNGSCS